MKHVGRMKNNGARVAIAYRTIPDDPHSCLVISTQGLGDSYHDTLMSLLESESGQQSNELAEILAVRRFPDGTVMLGYLHSKGHLRKVPTANVLVTPDSQTSIPLNELNVIIAKQKGVEIEDLAVTDGSPKKPKTTKTVEVVKESAKEVSTFEMTPAEMRSRADTLYKEAAKLRKDADILDPPKSKKKVVLAIED